MPNEFTLTLSRLSGHGSASTGTRSLVDSNGTKRSGMKIELMNLYQRGVLLFGFGVEKLMFGGIVFFSNARTILMILVIPDAPSE